MVTAPVLVCSTCDGYEFVDGDVVDGPKVRCPDCPPKERCIVHDLILSVGRRCPRCTREARNAVPLVVLSSSLPADLRARAARAAQPIERSVA